MEEKTFKKYQLWLEQIRVINSDDYNILSSFSEEEINDAFYKDLEFGTEFMEIIGIKRISPKDICFKPSLQR